MPPQQGDSVFDPYKAFSPLHGKVFDDLRGLYRALGQVRWKHLTELPVSYGVRELMEFARDQKWLTEDEDGVLRIQLTPEPRGRGKLSAPSQKAGRVAKHRKQHTSPTKVE
jgi:hypothetical protein